MCFLPRTAAYRDQGRLSSAVRGRQPLVCTAARRRRRAAGGGPLLSCLGTVLFFISIGLFSRVFLSGNRPYSSAAALFSLCAFLCPVSYLDFMYTPWNSACRPQAAAAAAVGEIPYSLFFQPHSLIPRAVILQQPRCRPQAERTVSRDKESLAFLGRLPAPIPIWFWHRRDGKYGIVPIATANPVE